MTKPDSITIPSIASTSLVLALSALVLCSCSRIYRNTHKRHPLSHSFADTLASIKNQFDIRGIDKYIIYSSVNGNCFGPSYGGRAKFYWLENDKFYCRTLVKDAMEKEMKDQTRACNAGHIFEEFRNKQLDTVTTFPLGHMYLDPATVDDIEVKYQDQTYRKRFENYPLINSDDTTHILFPFLMTIIKEQID